jgi:hypothetical protein
MKLDIETLELARGSHEGPEDGACVMELASYLAGEEWSDEPECVSPVIGSFLRMWNDDLDDAARQALEPYAARVLGTRGSMARDLECANMAAEWVEGIFTSTWCALATMPKKCVYCLTEGRQAIALTGGIAAEDASQWPRRYIDLEPATRSAQHAIDTGIDIAPTVAFLRASAFDLLDRMIAVYKELE